MAVAGREAISERPSYMLPYKCSSEETRRSQCPIAPCMPPYPHVFIPHTPQQQAVGREKDWPPTALGWPG